MQHPEAAIAELERVVREYRFKAVEIATSIEGAQVADKKFRPVLRTIEQLGCFVFTHPDQCSAKGGMDDYEFYNARAEALEVVREYFYNLLCEVNSLDDYDLPKAKKNKSKLSADQAEQQAEEVARVKHFLNGLISAFNSPTLSLSLSVSLSCSPPPTHTFKKRNDNTYTDNDSYPDVWGTM
jgi:hypothetical protein